MRAAMKRRRCGAAVGAAFNHIEHRVAQRRVAFVKGCCCSFAYEEGIA